MIYSFCRAVVRLVLTVVWRFRVLDSEKVPRTGPLIVAANHVGYFDPPALGCALPRPIHYMAKQELFAIPVLGWLIRRLNAFPVDRSQGSGAVKRAVEVLKSGAAMGIFPEGGRNREGTNETKTGAALLHYLSGAPIVPAYIAGTARANRLAPITVVYGEPLSFATGEKASREDLAKWTEEIMARIQALRGALGGD